LFRGGGDAEAEEFGVRSTSKVRTQPEVRHPHERINFLNGRDKRRWKRFERNKNKAPTGPSDFMPNRKRRIEAAESMEFLDSAETENSEASSQIDSKGM
jgi:hypothetical protein